ncbi:MAG TPA: adenosine deaminase [Pseudonocardiaceae bacterium]|nr:adenosine deaminase [Pseudonocardiaceae bacterium]
MRDIRALPKAHVHLHLTGSMRPATLQEFACAYQIMLPPALRSASVGWAGTDRDWSVFQARYDAARSTLRSVDDLRRVVREAAEDDAVDGSGWLELQVDPTSYAARFGGTDGVIEVLLESCRDAATATGMGIGLIVATSWARSGEHARALARLAARYAGAGVVGFGISGDERCGRPADFAAACRIAAAADLIRTPHAGYYTGPEHVRECVDVLGATRIGHGITAVRDQCVLDHLAAQAVALEICPTSYEPMGVLESVHQLPITALLDAGVPVAIGTDDPLLFGTRLAGQYQILRDVLGFDDEQLAVLARHSITASAAPAVVKQRLLAGVDAWLG